MDKTAPLLKSAKFINASSLLLIFTENVAAASCLASQFSLQNYSGAYIEVKTCTVATEFCETTCFHSFKWANTDIEISKDY